MLAGAVDRWAVEIKKKPSEPIISDFDALARNLTRLFEVRHILCHETPSKSVYAAGDVDEFLRQAILFTKALEEVLTFERFGLVPLTQTDMNIAAGESLIKKENELEGLLSEIRARVRDAEEQRPPLRGERANGNWLHCLDDAEEKWLSYRNAHCDFATHLNRGGTIMPLLWATEATRLTEIRLAELRSWLKDISEKTTL